MSTEIFHPMYYMLLLSVAVFLFITLIRMKEIYIDKRALEKILGMRFFQTAAQYLKMHRKIIPIYLNILFISVPFV